MSIDKIIADLMAKTDEAIKASTRNSDLLERVIAGQEAAMAKLSEGSGGGTTTRTRRSAKATETAADTAASTDSPAAAEEPVADPAPAAAATHPLLAAPNGSMTKNAKNEDTATAAYRAADFSRDQVKNEFIGWLGETENPDERKERAAFVAAIGQYFGVKQPFHPSDGLQDDEQRKQTLFYLRRKREGLKVDFSADYDFDGDPLADQTTDAAGAEEDPLG